MKKTTKNPKNLGISNRTVNTSASTEKGKLEHISNVLELGKLLEAQLQCDDNDILGLWMGQYIAEKLMSVENASEDQRGAVQTECCNEILKIWRFRQYFPGDRPMQNFESIFAVLEQLDSTKKSTRYVTIPDQGKCSQHTRVWLDNALAIDYSAKALVRFCLCQAAAAAEDKDLDWVKKAGKISDIGDDDVKTINKLLDYNYFFRPSSAKCDSLETAPLRDKLGLLVKVTKLLVKQLEEQKTDIQPD